MSELMIKVKNLSKKYKLGTIGGTTLKDELQRRKAKRKNQEDPTVKIGSEMSCNKGEEFFALSNISFEVAKGEAVGIIGHNGAGKSTLLKLITRITAPTEGKIYLNGRVASMLEVGTGFHQELTGRENIYVNGAILGMTKKEIDKKIEEIIDFSECREFIDTPVKRYSSGMYVKLAFSVSAHLDSEILIMDEVLAVGDVAFQNKCIEKMSSVAAEGKTILYVSHNMSTIRKLCKKCVVLDRGRITYIGDTERAIAVYMKNCLAVQQLPIDLNECKRYGKSSGVITLKTVDMLGKNNTGIWFGEKLKVRFVWDSTEEIQNLFIRLHIKKMDTTSIGVVYADAVKSNLGKNIAIYEWDCGELAPGQYSVTIIAYEKNAMGAELRHECVEPAFNFEVTSDQNNELFLDWNTGWGEVCFSAMTYVE